MAHQKHKKPNSSSWNVPVMDILLMFTIALLVVGAWNFFFNWPPG